MPTQRRYDLGRARLPGNEPKLLQLTPLAQMSNRRISHNPCATFQISNRNPEPPPNLLDGQAKLSGSLRSGSLSNSPIEQSGQLYEKRDDIEKKEVSYQKILKHF